MNPSASAHHRTHGVLLCLVLLLPFGAAAVPDVATFFRKPLYSRATLSPDGKFIAALLTLDDKSVLATYDIATQTLRKLTVPQGYDIYRYTWVSNEHLAYEISTEKRYAHMLGVADRELNRVRSLRGHVATTVVNGLVHDPKHLLLWLRSNPKENTTPSRLVLLDYTTNRIRHTEDNPPGRVIRWHTDHRGDVRLCATYRQGNAGQTDHYYRREPGDTWELVDIPDSLKIHGFAPDGHSLLVSGYYGQNTEGLYRLAVEGNAAPERVFRDSVYDFNGRPLFLSNAHWDPSLKLHGLYYDARVTTHVWFDTVLAEVQRMVDGAMRESVNTILGADRSKSLFLVSIYSDRMPRSYYLFDRHKRELQLVMETRPWVDSAQTSPTNHIAFHSHDTLKLSGYLTEPRTGTRPHPTVVLLHGGPWMRDTWGFDPRVQLLASRGYAVLQVNYRGSKGFGMEVSRKPRFDFGVMPSDVYSGVEGGIHSGIVDSTRVALMGSSFGGYLAIMNLALNPGSYACAVANAGVYDWELQLRTSKRKYNDLWYEGLYARLGPTGRREEYLRAISPVHMADRICVPVLLCGGKADKTVSIRQSYRLARELRKAGNPPQRFFRSGERHGFSFEKNSIEYYEKVLEFLGENL